MGNEIETNKELDNYKSELKRILEKSQESFEKQLSFISAGALGVTMAFLDKIVGNVKDSSCKGLLILSWLFLGATFIVNLFSHIIATKSYYKLIKELEQNQYSQEKASKRIQRINVLNIGSVICLLIGIVLVIIFISLNI